MGIEPSIRNQLDPQDWDEFQSFLMQMVDDVVEHLRDIREVPVWTQPTESMRAALNEAVPHEGLGPQETYRQFKDHILPHIAGNIHPKFWGWVVGSGAPTSMVGDWLAAFVNGVPTLFDDSSLQTELQVIDWIKQLVGVNKSASGVLTTGVSEGTLIALLVARYAAFGDGIKKTGVLGLSRDPVFYISDQTHDCSRKAIEILGFGRDHIRTIPSDDQYRMRTDSLTAAIKSDLREGRKPVAVIATIGTVNTGAFDDTQAIAEICRTNKIWLHVDGAFGIWASILNGDSRMTGGVEFADSVVFDMHKWMYQSYDMGCVLIRNAAMHKRALRVSADYLAHIEGTLTDAPEELSSFTIQLSRGFKALKFWFSLKSEGVSTFARAIDQNIQLANYLTRQILAAGDLELLAPTTLHIVNFRYKGGIESPALLDQCNTALLQRLHQNGNSIPSSTILDGKFSIRVCISNHRTETRDIDDFLYEVRSIGRDLARPGVLENFSRSD